MSIIKVFPPPLNRFTGFSGRHLPGLIALAAIIIGVTGLSAHTNDAHNGHVNNSPDRVENLSISWADKSGAATTEKHSDMMVARQITSPNLVANIDDTARAAINLQHPTMDRSTTTAPRQSAIAVDEPRLKTATEHPATDNRNIAPREHTTIEVRKGDSLWSVFKRAGLAKSDLNEVLALEASRRTLNKIYPGNRFVFEKRGSDQRLESVMFPTSPFDTFVVFRDEDGLATTVETTPKTHRTVTRSGIITSSLFRAAQKSDVPDKVTQQLVDAFGWDVNFALDLRAGDRFTVVFEGIYKGKKLVEGGQLLAASFNNQGQHHRAVWFDDKERAGYYDPDGTPLRKAFLTSPVKYSRISSRFQPKRWHPILKKWKAHRGVDYAAKTGTPVRSTGDGTVKTAGWVRGYGKVIMVNHGRGITTVYGHLSKFARSLKKGSKIKQGQLIGYVGMTGYATGPHLHYEVRINNKYKDPLKVKLPGAPPLSSKKLTAFHSLAQPLLEQLAKADTSMIAKNSP